MRNSKLNQHQRAESSINATHIFTKPAFTFNQYNASQSKQKASTQQTINKVTKRAFDILFSSLVILLVYPILMPIVALIIKLESKGSIFFMQERSGLKNKCFFCIKFRSMAMNRNANEKQATKGDARITKFGAFMRKTSIDELPQFINVFLGQMSVVGPRPHMLKHTEEYSEVIPYYEERLDVKPGVTGWAQVEGFRGPTETLDKMVGRVNRDIWYINNWSFLLDLKCIVKTVTNVFKGEENAF